MQLFSDSLLYNLTGIIFAVITIIIIYFKWTFTYWRRKGLYGPEPSVVFGNVKGWILQKTSIGEQFGQLYQHLKAKGLRHGGVYLGVMACYIPIDIDIVKNILQKDFKYFTNHGLYVNEKIDPLSGNLFHLEDDKWKNLRTKLNPAFSSTKVKMMFQTIIDCTKEMNLVLNKYAAAKSPVDIKDFAGRFFTNIIGSCAFGIECDCFKNADNEFHKHSQRLFKYTTLESIQCTIAFFLPRSVLAFFNFKSNRPYIEKFFMELVRHTVNYRETNNVSRNDFVHLLLQLKNRGKVSDDRKIMNDLGNAVPGLTMNELTAQCYVFFAAGFETSSTTLNFALFELTQNLDVQKRARKEINEVLRKYDGNLTYEACAEMIYLENVINETLRKYPPSPVLFRMCTKDYQVPDSNVCIEKGTFVIIPALSIHYDADYYPDPEKFDPDRFGEENKRNKPSCTFLTFGEGPRICIGLRFGMLQLKIGLITILKNYKVGLDKKTALPLKYTGKGFALATENTIWLNIEKIV